MAVSSAGQMRLAFTGAGPRPAPRPALRPAGSLGRTTQIRCVFGFRRLGLDRFDLGDLDLWRLDARRDLGPRRIGRAGLPGTTQRTRPRHRPRHQHLGGALMMEIAIGEAHARNRTAEGALVHFIEIETGLERNALDRGAHRLAANLKRVAGQADVAHRTRACKLHGAGGAHVVQYATCAAGAVEAGESEDLAGDEPARLIGGHHPGQRRSNQCTCRHGAQHKTRKHAATPTYPKRWQSLVPLPAAYHTNRGNAQLPKTEYHRLRPLADSDLTKGRSLQILRMATVATLEQLGW